MVIVTLVDQVYFLKDLEVHIYYILMEQLSLTEVKEVLFSE